MAAVTASVLDSQTSRLQIEIVVYEKEVVNG